MAGAFNLPGLATGNATTSTKGQFQVSGLLHEGDCHLTRRRSFMSPGEARGEISRLRIHARMSLISSPAGSPVRLLPGSVCPNRKRLRNRGLHIGNV